MPVTAPLRFQRRASPCQRQAPKTHYRTSKTERGGVEPQAKRPIRFQGGDHPAAASRSKYSGSQMYACYCGSDSNTSDYRLQAAKRNTVESNHSRFRPIRLAGGGGATPASCSKNRLGGTRTHDLLLIRKVFCQLNYKPSSSDPESNRIREPNYDTGFKPAPGELLTASAAMGWARIELATPAFSGRRSTAELPTRKRKAEESNPMRLRTTRFRGRGRADHDLTFQQKSRRPDWAAGLDPA